MKILKSIHWPLIILIVVAIFMFTGCANSCGLPEYGTRELSIPLTYNFFGGLLHGIVMPFAFIVSLTSPCIEMYASNNVGNWYDFGYLCGVIFSIGGGFKASSYFKEEFYN